MTNSRTGPTSRLKFPKSFTRVFLSFTDESTNADMVQNIRALSLPYPMKRAPYIFSGNFRAAFFMNPNQSRLFASAEHLNVDLTFTGNGYMPYLINVVTFDLETLECEYLSILAYFIIWHKVLVSSFRLDSFLLILDTSTMVNVHWSVIDGKYCFTQGLT